jgi:hypothetical protein
MILSTQNSLLKFKYDINDLLKIIQPLTFLKNRSRKDPTGSSLIEDKGMDEEDKLILLNFLESGSKRAYEVLTFLTSDVVKPYSWKEAGTESQNAVVITINKLDWMATNLPVLVDERIQQVIIEYTLYQWYKHNAMYDDMKVHFLEYENATQDLRTGSRLRKTRLVRPMSFP